MTKALISVLCMPILILILSCDKVKNSKDDPIVAKVHNQILRQSDLEKRYTLGMLSKDQKRKFIHDWVKEALIIEKGARDIKKENLAKLEQLVKEYKNTLISGQFEEEYLKKSLDKEISQAEIQQFFTENETTFNNNITHLKAQIAKLPADCPDIEDFNSAWNKSDSLTIKILCDKYEGMCLLRRDTLYAKHNLKVLLPRSLHKALAAGKNQRQKVGKYEYFVKTLEVYDNNDEKALEVHKENIIKSILFARKRQLLINLRDSLYNDAIEKNKVKIFLDE